MKTIERYVFGAFLSSFLLAFLMLSFVLTIGLLVQIVDYVMSGVPMALVWRFCLVSLPETLQWSMPLSLLVSSILVFSRLSADSEISAMRACGISMVSVMKWPVAFAVFCTLLGFWVNNEIVPRGHEVRRTLKTRVSVQTGLSLLEPGRFIDDFPKVKLYFGRKEGNWLYDLVVFDYSTPGVDRMITADKALVTQDGTDIHFELYHMTVDPVDKGHLAMGRANRVVYTLANVVKDKTYRRRGKDRRFLEMCGRISAAEAELATAAEQSDRQGRRKAELIRQDLCNMKVELNKRLVFAMASVCFVLIGIPLGIRSQRKESTVGMAISLGVSLAYYMLVILMLSCEDAYAIHPDMLIWLPVLLCMGLSAKLIRRHL